MILHILPPSVRGIASYHIAIENAALCITAKNWPPMAEMVQTPCRADDAGVDALGIRQELAAHPRAPAVGANQDILLCSRTRLTTWCRYGAAHLADGARDARRTGSRSRRWSQPPAYERIRTRECSGYRPALLPRRSQRSQPVCW